jgi:hypothetical protein
MSSSPGIVDRWRVSVAHSAVWDALKPVRILWREVEALLARLTKAEDSASMDRTTVAVAADSRTGQAFVACLAAVQAAWHGSQARRAWYAVVEPLVSVTWRIRAAGWIAVIAMSTALAMQLAASRLAPLSWLVPATVIAAGLVAIGWAEVLAAAIAGRRS